MGYASLLQTELREDDTLREYAQKIISSSQTAANLAQDLLTFSRKQPINPQPVNMNGIIKDAESILSKLIRENIKMNTMLTDKDCIVIADSDQMKHILMNLTTNAKGCHAQRRFFDNKHRCYRNKRHIYKGTRLW